jgi:plastocyanin
VKRKSVLQIGLLLSVGLLWQCAAAPTEPPPSSGHNVSITSSGFTPRTLTISVGETVTWTNNDNATHSVESGTFMNPSGDFITDNIGAGGSDTITFSSRGTFPYYCVIHPAPVKTGTITVN